MHTQHKNTKCTDATWPHAGVQTQGSNQGAILSMEMWFLLIWKHHFHVNHISFLEDRG